MPTRSVLVRMQANNGQFDAAMRASAQRVRNVGHQARLSGDVATLALYRMKAAAIGFASTSFIGAGQSLLNLKENAQIAFTSMTGSAETAKATIQKIYEWDQGLPIPFQNVLQNAQRLLAYGVDLKDIIPTLQAIADATGASGDISNFDRIALAMGQIQAKSRLQATEMRQLTEAGIPAWKMLADAIGTDVAGAMKLTEKRAISAKTALDALRKGIEERFPGAAAALKDTMSGTWKGFLAGLRDASASILATFQHVGKGALSAGHDIAEAFGSGIGNTIRGLGSLVSDATKPFRDLASSASGLAGGMGDLAPTLSAMSVALLGTHLASDKLASGWESLKIRGLLAADAAQSLSAGVAGLPRRLNTAARVSATARRSLLLLGTTAKTAGKAMLTAFGGPLGLAIIGATTAMSLWGKAQADAQAKEEQHKQVLNSLRQSFDQISGSITGATTAKIIEGLKDQRKQITSLGFDFDTVVASIRGVGAAQDQVRAKVDELSTAAVRSSDLWKKYGADLDAAGVTATEVFKGLAAGEDSDQYLAMLKDVVSATGQSALDLQGDFAAIKDSQNQLTSVYTTIVSKQHDVTESSNDVVQSFDDQAAQAAKVAGVTRSDFVSAMHDAYDSGTSLNQALTDLGVSADDQGKVIEALGDQYVRNAGDGMYYLTGASGDASNALKQVGDSADGAADKMSDLQKQAVAAMAATLQAGQKLRQSVSGALTSFVDPIGAWEKATQLANRQPSSGGGSSRSGKNPAVAAAEAAVKAGKRRADSTKESAKAERDAAVKAAKSIRDARVDQAKADVDAAKKAEKAARDRVSAAKKEADELKRIAEDQQKQADDAEQKLRDAKFRKRAADMAVVAAQQGLDSAGTPEERARWTQILADAVGSQSDATSDLATAQGDYNKKTDKAAKSKGAAKDATKQQTAAEKGYQKAQEHTADVTEDSKSRQKTADDEYTTAKEQADTRYNKSVGAVKEMLQKLIDKQDEARTSAQNMSTGASNAAADMTKNVQPSLDQYLAQLKKQVQQQKDWKNNIIELAGEIPPNVALELAKLGPKAAPLVQKLVDGTDAQLDEFSDLFPQSTQTGTNDMLQDILDAVIPAGQNAAKLGDKVIEKFLAQLQNAKTDQDAKNAIQGIINAMQQQATSNPIHIPTTLELQQAEQQLLQTSGDKWYTPHARGGMVSDGWFSVGEEGPELGYKSGSSVRIFPNGSGPTPAPPPGGSGPNITIIDESTTYYPQAEPKSEAMNRRLQLASAMVRI